MKSDPTIHRPILACHGRYRWDALRGQHQLVYPEGALVLNESGAAIVRSCDGRPVDELIRALKEEFPEGDVAHDVHEFLNSLWAKGLLRDSEVTLRQSLHPVRSQAEPVERDGFATRPYSLLAELTYRCPLKCPYCSNPLKLKLDQQELDTATWRRVLSEAAALGVIQVHFSGGEPLLRHDLAELIAEARQQNLYSHLITSGMGADEAKLKQLRDAGLDALQISLQDARATENDWLAGATSFEQKRVAVQAARRLDFPVTLNVVMHRHNLVRIAEFIELADQWNVDRLELAHVQYTGWAFRNRAALLPSREQVEHAAEVVDRARERLGNRLQILHVLPDYFQQFPKACLNGWGRVFVTVAPDGMVLPCQTAREIPGLDFPNVRDASLDEIWFHAPVFEQFRGTSWMPEPCRSCDRREIDFGGCRCQAFLLTGNVAATDPVCHLSPDHQIVQATLHGSPQPAPLQFRTYAMHVTAQDR